LLSFHSLSERHCTDRYLARACFRILGLAGNDRAIELEADLGFRHDDSVRSQI